MKTAQSASRSYNKPKVTMPKNEIPPIPKPTIKKKRGKAPGSKRKFEVRTNKGK